jgi:hypothetical protein
MQNKSKTESEHQLRTRGRESGIGGQGTKEDTKCLGLYGFARVKLHTPHPKLHTPLSTLNY